MNIETIILIIAIAVIAVIALIGLVVKWRKMSKEEKKQVLKNWLIGAVVGAQNYLENNEEKLQMVKDEFATKAPFWYKLLIRFTKEFDLEELIEEALTEVKNTKF